jgi:hypothetical protein
MENDVRPSLYICRKLINAKEVLAWAKSQGLEDLLDAHKLHATVVSSEAEFNWSKLSLKVGSLIIPPSPSHNVHKLGSAYVLSFHSSELTKRHLEILKMGAYEKFDNYIPHVSLSYGSKHEIDLDKVEPFGGTIVFGPEYVDEIDDDFG